LAKQKAAQPLKRAAHPKKNKKIIRYRRPLNIIVGMIIFALIFVMKYKKAASSIIKITQELSSGRKK